MPDPPTTAPPRNSRTLTDQLDRQIAQRAYLKLTKGEEPTAQERAALSRYEKEQEEARRWQLYGTIPQKHWREMSGRQTKVLQEQAARYGLPFGGKVINLPELVRALHDFLAANARKLCADEDDELLSGGGSSPALERYREERAIMARMDRQEREGVLVPKDQVRTGLGRIAAILRTAGETLQRQYGNGAAEILSESLEEAEREIGLLFGAEVPDGVSALPEPAETIDAEEAAE